MAQRIDHFHVGELFFFVERVGMMELKVSHLTRNAFMLAFVVCTGFGQTTRTVVSTLIGEGRQQDLPRALLALVVELPRGVVFDPQLRGCKWIAGHFFDRVEEPVGHAAMADTLGTAWIAINATPSAPSPLPCCRRGLHQARLLG